MPYENKVVPGKALDKLLERGMGILKRVRFCDEKHAAGKIEIKERTEKRGDYEHIITFADTPYGGLRQTVMRNGLTDYISEHFVKTPGDYKAYKYMQESLVFSPDYSEIEQSYNTLDQSYYIRCGTGYEPIQKLIINAMGTEAFCYQWMDNREELLELADCLERQYLSCCMAAAGSPMIEMVNIGGNVVPDIIGVDTFKKFHLRHYNEAARILHEKGKLAGAHLDGDNSLILDLLETSGLDYIEAYDTSCSPPLKKAVKRAPSKVYWVNFPSAVHLSDKKTIYDTAIRLLSEGAEARGLVIGVTEDVPKDRWEFSYNVIMDAIDDFYGSKN